MTNAVTFQNHDLKIYTNFTVSVTLAIKWGTLFSEIGVSSRNTREISEIIWT